MYSLCDFNESITSVYEDIRNFNALFSAFKHAKPEIVIHLAAQPLVRASYESPAYTYETNVIGTVNILECIRRTDFVRSFLNVTTDKVYQNNEWVWGYREYDPLGGFDPYANSKSCSEFVTQSYVNSFFSDRATNISTARSGNVIGGGDFAADRIVPDFIRAVSTGEKLIVRNPLSIRPYQHVLEALGAYLLIIEKQYNDKKYAGAYNVGPDDNDCITTGDLVNMLCDEWGGNNMGWIEVQNNGPHESNYLKLDCSKIKNVLQWKPRWCIKEAVANTAEWYKAYLGQENIQSIMDAQINTFLYRRIACLV